jgi:hypothetical protein
MAVDQMPVRSATVPKYEAQFEQQLRRAVGRVRFLDVMAALLALAAGTLLYALLVIGLDRWLILSGSARQFALILYLIIAAAFIGYCIVRPLLRSVNPYYAAKRLEQTVPEAKNSVVNWLDLRNLELPGAIRTAVGQRAAQDAVRADLDAAISGKRAAWAGGGTGLLFIALLITLAILGPAQFWSLLGRAFGPFSSTGIRTRTQIELKQPQGDAVVPVGNSVPFAATITGKVPAPNRADAPRLLFRYRLADPYEERPLERERDNDFVTTLPANQVHGGFWYKIAAGDAETDEYQVRVRAGAFVEKIDVEYRYREYLGWKNQTISDPNITAVRGTEVVVTAHTNRPVRTAQCIITGKANYNPTLAGEPVSANANAVQFKFTVEQSGLYRISFVAVDGESNSEHSPYTITAMPDREPNVKLTKPGQDVTLPANGLLQLEGAADDDLGVASMTLRMQVGGGSMLQPKPYRGGKSFKLADGGYPKMLEYKDAVELNKLQDDQGKPFPVAPKMIIEYWLEAKDACDFPEPNTGESKHFKVVIGEPDKDKQKQQEERNQAAKDQQNHEQKQDKNLDKENQERKEQQNKEQQNKDQQNKDQQNKDQQNKDGANQQKKDGGDQNNKQQDSKQGGDSNSEQTEKNLENQIQKQQEEQKAQNKPDNSEQKNQQEGNNTGENGQQQTGKGKDKQEQNPADGTGAGQDSKVEPGKEKGSSAKPDGSGGQQGDAKKSGGKDDKQDKADAKSGAGEGQPNAAEKKEQPQPQPTKDNKAPKGSAKDNGQKGSQPDAAQPKDQGNAKDGQKPQQGQGKGPGKDDKGQKAAPKGDTKPGDQPPQGDPQKDGSAQGGDPKKGPKAEDPSRNGTGTSNSGDKNTDPKKEKGTGSSNSGKNNNDPTKQENPKDPQKNTDGNAGDSKPKTGDPKKTEGNGRGSNTEKSGEKVTKEDVAKLAEQMKKGDEKQQADAAKDLAQAAQNAKDNQARDQAREELKKADRDTQTGQPNPGTPKEGPKKEGQQPPNGQTQGEAKNRPKNQDAQTGDTKDETGKQPMEKSERKPVGKSTGNEEDKGPEQPAKGNPNGPPKGKTTEKPGQPNGSVPGGGKPGDENANTPQTPMSGTKPNELDRQKKNELMLERFDKMMDKEKKKFLEDAKISDEDMKRFREDVKRRRARMNEDAEKVIRGTGPATQRDAAASRVGTGGKPRAADTQYGGRGSPPPEFRDPYREFTGEKEKK